MSETKDWHGGRDTQSWPQQPTAHLTEALRVLGKAQARYINVIRNRQPSGCSSADIRHSAGEIKASAEEAMFEEFGALTFENVNALIAAISRTGGGRT